MCLYTVREFSVEELTSATENFSESKLLGKGGFGSVYQGYIKGTKVAIKKFTEVRSLAMYITIQLASYSSSLMYTFKTGGCYSFCQPTGYRVASL